MQILQRFGLRFFVLLFCVFSERALAHEPLFAERYVFSSGTMALSFLDTLAGKEAREKGNLLRQIRRGYHLSAHYVTKSQAGLAFHVLVLSATEHRRQKIESYRFAEKYSLLQEVEIVEDLTSWLASLRALYWVENKEYKVLFELPFFALRMEIRFHEEPFEMGNHFLDDDFIFVPIEESESKSVVNSPSSRKVFETELEWSDAEEGPGVALSDFSEEWKKRREEGLGKRHETRGEP